MRSRISNKLRAWVRAWDRPEQVSQKSEIQYREASSPRANSLRSAPPTVQKFYEDLITKNLASFNIFALQSRSVLARDMYARAASNGRHDMLSLQMEIDELLNHAHHDKSVLELGNYSARVLLSLSNYILNTSRSDLDTHAGIQLLRFVLLASGAEVLSQQDKLQFIEALGSIGAYDEQDRLTEHFDLHTSAPVQVELLAIDRLAHQQGGERAWLEAMNQFYLSRGMHTIRLDGDTSLPLLDRLMSNTSEKIEGPLVSVIIPTFSPGRRIHTAVNSLLRQTWENLEILIVDDGSPSDYDHLFFELAELDSRIRIIRQASNSGAYTARNAGLAQADGVFVTTHDDDDWSHPDKIAEQASVLMADESVVATTVGHIRTTSDMKFRRINSRPVHLQTNFSSLMFRRAIADELGVWDTSKRGSDTELVERIRAHYGKAAVAKSETKPLSFSRVWDGSLTSGEIYRGYISPSRLLYRWSFRQWHREVMRQGDKPTLNEGQARPFAVPTSFEPNNKHKNLGCFDVIYVTDYSRRAKFASDVLHEIRSAIRAGLRVGYMHINSPQTVKKGDVAPELFEMQYAGEVTQIAETDNAEARLLVVYDSAIGMFLDQFQSTVKVRTGIVVDVSPTSLLGAARPTPRDPRTVLQHLDRSFNTTFSVVGATLEDQRSLKKQLPPTRLLSDNCLWATHLTSAPGPIRLPAQPSIVGFHSFGNKYRWPARREIFEQIYLSDNTDTVFYGNIGPARSHLGADIISDHQLVSSQEYSLKDFLEKIDFWVYYPHDRLGVRPWLPTLEAMQAGKVVILPPHLHEIYGEAAVYATPDHVAPTIARYQAGPEYMKQARRGQEFVEKNYSQEAFVTRLTTLINAKEANI